MTASGTTPTSPSLTLVARSTYADGVSDGQANYVAGLVNVTSHDPHVATLDPDASQTVTPASAPASFVAIVTPRPVRMRINGGTQDLVVSRMFIFMGTVTEVELFNDQGSNLKQVQVRVTFCDGDVGS